MAIRQKDRVLSHNNLFSLEIIKKMNTKELIITKTQK